MIKFDFAQARAATPVYPLPTNGAEEGVLVVIDFLLTDWAEVGLGRAGIRALTRQQKKEKEGRRRVKEEKEEKKRRLTKEGRRGLVS